MSAVTLRIDADGIGIATLDLPGRSMNVLNDELMQPLVELLRRLETDEALKGLVLTSGKRDFIAGADIDRLARFESAQEAFDATMAYKAVLRRMELCGKPVVAAINGVAFGGGMELLLACHWRVMLNDPGARLGQPEVKLGLMPGGGACVRLPRMIGMQAALQLMAEGNDVRADKALAMGLVNELAGSREELLAKAGAWARANPNPRQPWDQPKFRFPGGDSRAPSSVQLFTIAPSIAGAKTQDNYPAVRHIQSAVFEGGLLDFDAACAVESRYFAACAMSQESRNMIGTLWYQLNAIKKGRSRPRGHPASKVRKLGILGAGMMGAGIAHVCAKAGLDVVLLDRTEEEAQRGRSRAKLALQQRIKATARHEDLADCDLVIEAVFEDRALKAEVTARAEKAIAADAVFASNTSTLPITGLAKASARPANFIGLHFFSPVEKMPLVEIIVGEQTSAQTLARAFDYVLQIGKTPIVVNDSRGFYTSRVFATYVMEGAALLKEGVHPRSIEAAGLKAGMPMPPLALQDEVSLSLGVHVAEQTKKDLASEGKTLPEHPGMSVLRALCEIGRVGKKAGKGFYDWSDDGKRLWPELTRLYPTAAQQPEQRELIDRLMFVQANEAARCFEEGVVTSVADANIGSIFGWGFAPFHGGVLQFINAMGPAKFVERSLELARRYGARFEPAGVIVRMAQREARFQD